ncbi:hypothetical protein RHGRI_018936 [Rhododendron griersonianum]|uniref:Uncharacterized protein n=1 Tax=Rhododendron griersonianum TaxID=479676 RepID=A0AAV6JF45_9ERIC|nr:hypothetical protein RHGRI_018936 [Rhododendron griersonianum]
MLKLLGFVVDKHGWRVDVALVGNTLSSRESSALDGSFCSYSSSYTPLRLLSSFFF